MLVKSNIKFIYSINNTACSVESGVCYVRLFRKDGGVQQVDLILEESDDWERNYILHCTKPTGSTIDDTGYQGSDKKGVRVSVNFINPITLMGYWEEDGFINTIIIDMRAKG